MPPLDRVQGGEIAARLGAGLPVPPALRLRVPGVTPPPEPAFEFDAIGAAAALEERLREPAGPGGLARTLMQFVAPPEGAFTSPVRLLGMLELTAGMLDQAPEDDDIAQLGARAIRQELEAHRDLAARRGGLLGP